MLYIYSISSQRTKIHILLKCTGNIVKDRPHDRTQNKPQQVKKKLKSYQEFFLTTRG